MSATAPSTASVPCRTNPAEQALRLPIEASTPQCLRFSCRCCSASITLWCARGNDGSWSIVPDFHANSKHGVEVPGYSHDSGQNNLLKEAWALKQHFQSPSQQRFVHHPRCRDCSLSARRRFASQRKCICPVVQNRVGSKSWDFSGPRNPSSNSELVGRQGRPKCRRHSDHICPSRRSTSPSLSPSFILPQSNHTSRNEGIFINDRFECLSVTEVNEQVKEGSGVRGMANPHDRGRNISMGGWGSSPATCGNPPEGAYTEEANRIKTDMTSKEHKANDSGNRCSSEGEQAHADANLNLESPDLRTPHWTVAEGRLLNPGCGEGGWKISTVDELEKRHRIGKEFVANVLKRECEGDGNCLYRAFSDQLYGSQDYHFFLRKLAVDVMRRNRSNFEAFVDESEGPFEKFLKVKDTYGEWADHREMYALMILYRRPVFVFNEDMRLLQVFDVNAPTEKHYAQKLQYLKQEFPLARGREVGQLEVEGLVHLLGGESSEEDAAGDLGSITVDNMGQQQSGVDSDMLATGLAITREDLALLAVEQERIFAMLAKEKNDRLTEAACDIVTGLLKDASEEVLKRNAVGRPQEYLRNVGEIPDVTATEQTSAVVGSGFVSPQVTNVHDASNQGNVTKSPAPCSVTCFVHTSSNVLPNTSTEALCTDFAHSKAFVTGCLDDKGGNHCIRQAGSFSTSLQSAITPSRGCWFDRPRGQVSCISSEALPVCGRLDRQVHSVARLQSAVFGTGCDPQCSNTGVVWSANQVTAIPERPSAGLPPSFLSPLQYRDLLQANRRSSNRAKAVVLSRQVGSTDSRQDYCMTSHRQFGPVSAAKVGEEHTRKATRVEQQHPTYFEKGASWIKEWIGGYKSETKTHKG